MITKQMDQERYVSCTDDALLQRWRLPTGTRKPSYLEPFMEPNIGYRFKNSDNKTNGRRIREDGKKHSRILRSVGASTSGRSFTDHIDIESIINLQSERLQAELKAAAARRLLTTVSIAQQQLGNLLNEKEIELKRAKKLNAEFEERVNQLSKESQRWLQVAQQSEALVTSLSQGLAQALLISKNNAAVAQKSSADENNDLQLGADDAESCCFGHNAIRGSPAMNKKCCKACNVGEVNVLLLPCRHLCLCRDCEPMIVFCPLCGIAKNATLNVFF